MAALPMMKEADATADATAVPPQGLPWFPLAGEKGAGPSPTKVLPGAVCRSPAAVCVCVCGWVGGWV
jgi:hypothetical protein